MSNQTTGGENVQVDVNFTKAANRARCYRMIPVSLSAVNLWDRSSSVRSQKNGDSFLDCRCICVEEKLLKPMENNKFSSYWWRLHLTISRKTRVPLIALKCIAQPGPTWLMWFADLRSILCIRYDESSICNKASQKYFKRYFVLTSLIKCLTRQLPLSKLVSFAVIDAKQRYTCDRLLTPLYNIMQAL